MQTYKLHGIYAYDGVGYGSPIAKDYDGELTRVEVQYMCTGGNIDAHTVLSVY